MAGPIPDLIIESTMSATPRISASSGLRRISAAEACEQRRLPAQKSELRTLKCLSCHAHVHTSTIICAMLYHTARELVDSLRSRKFASRSRWYCCSRRMSSSFKFRSRSFAESSETCDRSCSASAFVAPTTMSRYSRTCVLPNHDPPWGYEAERQIAWSPASREVKVKRLSGGPRVLTTLWFVSSSCD